MRVGVGEGTETVVIFLAGGIPEGELDVLAVDLDIGDVVLEDSGDIDLDGVSGCARRRALCGRCGRYGRRGGCLLQRGRWSLG